MTADDDADNQSGDNRGDLLINLSDRSARFFEFCNQAVSLMLGTDHNQRPAVKPIYAATVDCLTDITTTGR